MYVKHNLLFLLCSVSLSSMLLLLDLLELLDSLNLAVDFVNNFLTSSLCKNSVVVVKLGRGRMIKIKAIIITNGDVKSSSHGNIAVKHD